MAHPADISVIGPLARSAADLELALSVMAGPDAIDGAGWMLELPAPARKSLRGLRVAVLATHPTAETDATVQHALGRLAQFERNAFAALNTAFLHDGALIVVPRGRLPCAFAMISSTPRATPPRSRRSADA